MTDLDMNWLGLNAVSIGVPEANLAAVRTTFPWLVWTSQSDFNTFFIHTADFFPETQRLNFKKLTRALDWAEGSIPYDRLLGLMHTQDMLRFHREIIQ